MARVPGRQITLTLENETFAEIQKLVPLMKLPGGMVNTSTVVRALLAMAIPIAKEEWTPREPPPPTPPPGSGRKVKGSL